MTLRTKVRSMILSAIGSFKKPAPYVHILNGHMVDWHHDNDSDGYHLAIAELIGQRAAHEGHDVD